MVIILISLLLAGCGNRYQSYATEAGPEYRFAEKMEVGEGVERLENSEVICYRNSYAGGLSCKWKEIETKIYLDARGE